MSYKLRICIEQMSYLSLCFCFPRLPLTPYVVLASESKACNTILVTHKTKDTRYYASHEIINSNQDFVDSANSISITHIPKPSQRVLSVPHLNHESTQILLPKDEFSNPTPPSRPILITLTYVGIWPIFINSAGHLLCPNQGDRMQPTKTVLDREQ